MVNYQITISESVKRTQLTSLLFFIWGIAIVAMVCLSLVPWVAPPQAYNLDKALHFAAFFGLSFIILLLINRLSLSLIVVVFMAVTGAVIEIFQNYVPKRSGSWADLLADFAGILLAFLLVRIYHYYRKTTKVDE